MGIRGGKGAKRQAWKRLSLWRREPSQAALGVLKAGTGFRNAAGFEERNM